MKYCGCILVDETVCCIGKKVTPNVKGGTHTTTILPLCPWEIDGGGFQSMLLTQQHACDPSNPKACDRLRARAQIKARARSGIYLQ